MGSTVEALYESTVDLVKRLETAEHHEFSALVELRDEVLRHVLQNRDTVSDENKRKLLHIGHFDTVIVGRMQELKDEAARGIHKIGQTRLQKRVYRQEYTPDSFFFDKRK